MSEGKQEARELFDAASTAVLNLSTTMKLSEHPKGSMNTSDSACQVEQFRGVSLLPVSPFAPCLRICKSAFGIITARSKESEL